MDIVLSIVRDVFLIAGALTVLIGALGIVRLPELFSRLHAASVTDAAGAGLIIAGLLIEAGFSLISIKLLIILAFLFLTSPTSSHALAKAAIHGKVMPVVKQMNR